jgi:predicted restriction endonuclease
VTARQRAADRLPPGNVLLSREAFGKAALARDSHRCVRCGLPAADAHHIVERKLWPDGGYYLHNAASLCAVHHLEAETTVIGAEELRSVIGIQDVLLPPCLDPAYKWDKRGNGILPDGNRLPGPLFDDDGCRKALRRGNLLRLFPPDTQCLQQQGKT